MHKHTTSYNGNQGIFHYNCIGMSRNCRVTSKW